MPRKIQRKSSWHSFERVSFERVSKEQTADKSISIQQVITVLGGVTGLFVALLWIAGRFYAAGYFGAMNIPSFQINFSVWEYAEVSWLKLIFFFFKQIFPPLVLIAVVSLTVPLAAFILQTLSPNLRSFDAVKNILLLRSRFPSGARSAVFFSVVVYFSYLFLLALIDINRTGQIEGKKVVFTSSYAVEMFSKDSLPLGTPSVTPNTTSPLMHYTGLRLLTFNNGRYYLFRDIDPVTCKPSQVFVVSDNPAIQIVLRDIAPIDSPCIKSVTSTPTTPNIP